MAHMPRNSPSCRIGSAAGITVRGVTRLATWAPTANCLGVAHQPEDLTVGEVDADARSAGWRSASRPAASVTRADEYSLGNFAQDAA